MADSFYPSVDCDFIETHVKSSGRLIKDGIYKLGPFTTFIIDGPQAVHKRSIVVREPVAGQVCFEQAIAIALRFSFLGALLEWLEKNRDWKDGGYFIPKESAVGETPGNT